MRVKVYDITPFEILIHFICILFGVAFIYITGNILSAANVESGIIYLIVYLISLLGGYYLGFVILFPLSKKVSRRKQLQNQAKRQKKINQMRELAKS